MLHKKPGSLLMGIGLVCLLSAFALTGYNLWDMNRAAKSSEQVSQQLTAVMPQIRPKDHVESVVAAPEIPDYVLAPNMAMPEKVIDNVAYIGMLEIPDLNLSLPVASGWSDALLKNTPCRYAGSAYTDNLVIAAHNYARHFGNLKELRLDSEIYFTDVSGNVFCYAVSEFEILPPTAIEAMQSNTQGLTLFTCTIGGQDRITLRAVRTDI